MTQYRRDKWKTDLPFSEALEKSLEFLNSEVEVLQAFFSLSDSILGIIEREENDFRFLFLNEAVRRVSGIDPNTFRGKRASEIQLPPDIFRLWLKHMDISLATDETTHFEYERSYSHEVRNYRISITYLGDGLSGRPTFAYLAKDLTTLRRSEAELKKNELLFKQTQEFGKLGTWEIDLRSGVIAWSSAMSQVFDLGDREPPKNSQEFMRLIHPDDQSPLEKSIARAIEKLLPHHTEFRVFDRSGQVRWLEGRGQPVPGPDGKAIRMLGVTLDISERKNAEKAMEAQAAKMMHLSKMSALGEMAGGIAHEINNPLTIIAGSTALLKRHLQKPIVDRKKLASLAADLDETTHRIAKIVEGLRFFARDGSEDAFVAKPFGEIILDTLSFCAERFKKHGITLTLPDIPANTEILCQPVQISQVILNLLNNAHDAVIDRDVKEVRLVLERTADSVRLCVEDSGVGVKPEVAHKIFKPFFTTKEVGKGTGLGLSISKGIVEAHSGSLTYERVRGRTCFFVTLPLSRSEGVTAKMRSPKKKVSKNAKSKR